MSEYLQLDIDDCWHRIGVWGRERPRCPKLEEHIHCYNCEVFRAAGHRLRDRPLPADYQAEWSEIIANRKPERELNGLAVLAFRIGREWLALPAELVEEIVEVRSIHSLPHRSSPVLLGLTNIRGKLRLCVSLAGLLGIEADNAPTRQKRDGRSIYPRLLVVKQDAEGFVFPADEVLGTHRYAAAEVASLPATLSGALTRYSTGTLTVEGNNVGLLDPELLFYAFARSLV